MDVPHFVGRARELEQLSRLLDEASGTGASLICAITGTAAVGKTVLAVHWAHQVAERFPDGQLYVNLRGNDPAQPMTAGDALARLLHALGVRRRGVPAADDGRTAQYHSLLARKRILVVLDNAGSAEQIRPLLPGPPACTTVVTSRNSLTGLVPRDGAQHLDLAPLLPRDAVTLLGALIGARVNAEPGAAAALSAECCRLPLALRVAAQLAAARAAVPLADLVDELADQKRRLDLPDVGTEPHAALRTVFSWSYWHLDADAARMFRLVGLHPRPELDRYAVAALIGTTAQQAGRLLDLLARANLIQPARQGRYDMHDLLHAYARELAYAHDAENERQAALTRLFDYYLQAAATA